jgi:hypothetical protein
MKSFALFVETVDASKYKAYKPRVFKGVKPTDFSKYIRSLSELRSISKELLGRSEVTLQCIIDLFAIHNYKLADNFTPVLKIADLWKIREYDRDLIDGYTGKNSTKEMEDLKTEFKKHGIMVNGWVRIDRRKNGDVEVLLTEGNHRVKIARELGIKEMPIMFTYSNKR